MKNDVDELQRAMEQIVDSLAALARTRVDSGEFFVRLLGAALRPGGASRALLWRPAGEGSWQLAGCMPSSRNWDSRFLTDRQVILTEVAKNGLPRFVRANGDGRQAISAFDGSERTMDHRNPMNLDNFGNKPSGELHSELFIPVRQSAQTIGILETAHETFGNDELPGEVVQFLAMLCEIAADYFAQFELHQLRQLRLEWKKWDQFSQQLWASLDLDSVCAVIANEGRLLVDCDRVSVLVRQGRSYRLNCVSGVDRTEPRSSATQSLESLATVTARSNQPIWLEQSMDSVANRIDPHREEVFRHYLRDSGAKGVGLFPMTGDSSNINSFPPVAILVFDQFKAIDDSAGWQLLCQSFANRVSPVLRSAVERDEIPWLKLWQSLQRLSRRIRQPSFAVIPILAVGIGLALTFIPAPFTISAAGELWPERRREIFASTSGIVDEILVAHGDKVTKGQPLIVLRDPELESDAPRILGEIATTGERLKGIQTARFSEGGSIDAISRARQLTADEEELKERLKTLGQQKALIDERNAGLTLRSPIVGKVLTWDVTQHLSARPVERGQSLLTVGETSGPWILDVRVADKDVGHLLRARQEQGSDLAIDFLLTSHPEQVYQGRLREMSNSSESDDSLHGNVQVVVAIESEKIEHLRPGATVSTRIHCGRKPLGYVWLRDLIEAIRTRILF